MQNLLHRTIETGHEYLSPRDEVAPDVLGALRPLVAQALATGAVVAIDAEWSLGCRDHQGRLRAGLWYGAVGTEPHILMTVTRSAGLNPPLLEVSVAGLFEVNPALQHKVAAQGQELELSLAWAWLGGVQ